MKRLPLSLVVGLLILTACSQPGPSQTIETAISIQEEQQPVNKWSNIINKTRESIVKIDVRFEIQLPVEDPIFMQHGTGFAISPTGLIVTCAHILIPPPSFISPEELLEIAQFIKIETKMLLPNGEVISTNKKLVAIDIQNDIAIIDIESAYPFQTLDFESNIPELGQEVLTMGYPGIWGLLVDEGIISKITVPYKCMDMESLIVTTIPASGGSSGSPVLNSNGKVVGIIEAVPNKVNGKSLIIPAWCAQNTISSMLLEIMQYRLDNDTSEVDTSTSSTSWER